jgi:toxin ParE1/3/4
MRTLRWEAEARRQLRDTLTYIASHNDAAAERLRTVIEAKLNLLLQFAEMGRPGRVAKTRELIVHPNYVVVYAIRRNTIDVIRILHARQLYP